MRARTRPLARNAREFVWMNGACSHERRICIGMKSIFHQVSNINVLVCLCESGRVFFLSVCVSSTKHNPGVQITCLLYACVCDLNEWGRAFVIRNSYIFAVQPKTNKPNSLCSEIVTTIYPNWRDGRCAGNGQHLPRVSLSAGLMGIGRFIWK